MKNFSLLLALRYLNPIRTHVSVITLISLLGVAAGVMVLVVTLSVMNGFEGLLKNIMLSSNAHIQLDHDSKYYSGVTPITRDRWEPLKAQLEQQNDIVSVSPQIADFVVTEFGQTLLPTQMRGVDTSSANEVEKIQNQIEAGNGDASKLAEGDKAVISSSLALRTGLQINDKLLVHSSNNLKKIKPVYNRLETDLLYFREKPTFDLIKANLDADGSWTATETSEIASIDLVQDLLNTIIDFAEDSVAQRKAEQDILDNIAATIREYDSKDEDNHTLIYPLGHKALLLEQINSLGKLDKKEVDNEELRSIKEVVLPKELEIVGIYQTNNFVQGIGLFVPFSIAQDLVDLEGGIQSLSITLKDPDKAALIKDNLMKDPKFGFKGSLGAEPTEPYSEWTAITWMEKNEKQFSLMALQKYMMIFVLSFIVLIAVFSIAAVMFTVAIQKRREIGVMKALGATPAQIIKVFAYQGLIVGFIGSLSGVIVGYLVIINIGNIQTFMKEKLNFNPFPKNFYGIDTLPTKMVTQEFLIVSVGALILCTIASLIPAWSASRSDVARSLRNL